MEVAEHPEPVEGCGFAEPSSFDRLRMTILVSGLSSNRKGKKMEPPVREGSILKLRTAYCAGLSMVHFSHMFIRPRPKVRFT